MNMDMQLYHKTASGCSRHITREYSTSFSLCILLLAEKFREPVYGIYGFVRLADEIVDTFHHHDKKSLLNDFRNETYKAIDAQISLNPVLHSFQAVVNKYGIEIFLIEAFFSSMEMDIDGKTYLRNGYDEYIYGSAEVVGLMCLKVFCEGDNEKHEQLKALARKLGAAFQKVNFLRDMKSDYDERGRIYFPGVDFTFFSNESKQEIEKDIEDDFKAAYEGIIQLPKEAKAGVYLAYIYYSALFSKIKRLPASEVKNSRVRVTDTTKLFLLMKTYMQQTLAII